MSSLVFTVRPSLMFLASAPHGRKVAVSAGSGSRLDNYFRPQHPQAGRLPAAALGSGLETLQAGDADLTRGKAHLVAHHAALQQRSYLSALRSLHRFFDYNAGESRSGPGPV